MQNLLPKINDIGETLLLQAFSSLIIGGCFQKITNMVLLRMTLHILSIPISLIMVDYKYDNSEKDVLLTLGFIVLNQLVFFLGFPLNSYLSLPSDTILLMLIMIVCSYLFLIIVKGSWEASS